jgi:folate-binding protein YgfZ
LPDNHSLAPPPCFALPDHALIALEGVDATAFAQAQFANDVAALTPGHWQWNAWLTPKGRVIAVFALLKLAEDSILLVVPDLDAGEFTTQLQRLVFRRKLKVEAHSAMQVSGTFAAASIARNARIGMIGESIEIDYGDADQPRSLRISAASLATPDSQASAAWMQYDLQHGLVRLPAGQREQWTPQQLSLERLPAFSVKKGCYPGQEIVARTHFLGKAKRGLVLFEADAPVEAGMEVSDGERVIGTVVSACAGDISLALAVLPLDRSVAPLHAGGQNLREVALQGGLER